MCASDQHGPVASEWCRDLYPPRVSASHSCADYAARGIIATIPPPELCRLKQGAVAEAPQGCIACCGQREKEAA